MDVDPTDVDGAPRRRAPTCWSIASEAITPISEPMVGRMTPGPGRSTLSTLSSPMVSLCNLATSAEMAIAYTLLSPVTATVSRQITAPTMDAAVARSTMTARQAVAATRQAANWNQNERIPSVSSLRVGSGQSAWRPSLEGPMNHGVRTVRRSAIAKPSQSGERGLRIRPDPVPASAGAPVPAGVDPGNSGWRVTGVGGIGGVGVCVVGGVGGVGAVWGAAGV